MLAVRQNDPYDLMNREFGRMLRNFWGAEVPASLAPYAVDVHEKHIAVALDWDVVYVEAEVADDEREAVDKLGVYLSRAARSKRFLHLVAHVGKPLFAKNVLTNRSRAPARIVAE